MHRNLNIFLIKSITGSVPRISLNDLPAVFLDLENDPFGNFCSDFVIFNEFMVCLASPKVFHKAKLCIDSTVSSKLLLFVCHISVCHYHAFAKCQCTRTCAHTHLTNQPTSYKWSFTLVTAFHFLREVFLNTRN